MSRRLLTIITLSVFALTGCMPGPPATAARPVAVGPIERVIRAAVVAATSTDWVPKTISPEGGYIMAERTEQRAEPYRLELMIGPAGVGLLNAKVTPLSGRSPGTGSGASELIKKFLDAFDEALAATK
ncbi:MAG: hypothetical protein ABJF01_18785 [bacterium]